MNGRTLTLTVLMVGLLCPASATAQLVIPSTDYTSRLGKTLVNTSYEASDTTGAAALVLAAGPDQTWDFTGFPFPDSLIFTSTRMLLALPAGTPGESELSFADADFVMQTEVINVTEARTDTIRSWTYQGLVQDSLLGYGVTTAIDTDDDGIAESSATSIQSPLSLDELFPITYELQWTDSTSNVIVQDPIIFPVSAVLTEAEVDGWGTLITPMGSAPALRVRRTIQTIELLFMTESTETTLSFLTGLGGGLYANIDLDEDGAVERVSYGFEGEDVGTATEPTAVGDGFRLAPNYPNPFNSTTEIAYTVPEASPVRLAVYNLLGQEVAVLHEGMQAAGQHRVRWDATGMASGLYLYTLNAGAYHATRPMLLTK